VSDTPYQYLLFTTLLAVVLNIGAFFGLTMHVDSWIVGKHLKDKNYSKLKEFYNEVGMPQHAYILIFLWRASRCNFQLAGILLILLRVFHALAFYVLLIEVLRLNHEESLAITLIALLYPSQEFIHDIQIAVQYGVLWPLYTIGLSLYVTSANSSPARSIAILALTSVLTFLSYAMKSILFVSPFVYGGIFLQKLQINSELITIEIVGHLWLIALPLIYWYLNERYFPRKGNYVNLNQFLPFTRVFRVLRKTLEGFSHHTYGSLQSTFRIFRNPELSVLTIAVTIISILSFSSYSRIRGEQMLSLLIIGLLLVIICVIPYAMVNQDFDSKGYLTKNSIMCDVGYSLILYAIILLLFPNAIQGQVITLLLALSLLYNLESQYYLWIQYAKQVKLLQAFKSLEDNCDSAFIVEDLSSLKQVGKKNKFYPMTLFYMANLSNKKKLLCGFAGKFVSKDETIRLARESYRNSLLPKNKKSFNPKIVMILRISDNKISLGTVLKFVSKQFRKSPYSSKLQVDLFSVEKILIEK